MSETSQPHKEAAFFTTIRSWGLTRGDNGVVGGVVEGLGQRIGMARVPARLLTVVAWFILPGFVMLGYAAAWGLLPDRRGTIIIQNFGRGVTNVGALLGIAVLSLAGLASLNNGFAFGILGGGVDPFPWDDMAHSGGMFGVLGVIMAIGVTIAVLAGVAVLLVVIVRRSRDTPPGPGGPQGAVPPPPPPAAPGAGTVDASTADAPAGSGVHAAPDGASAGVAAASAPPVATSTGAPQPWEPALLPGDPRAGVAPSKGATAGVAAATAMSQPGHGQNWQTPAPSTPASAFPYDPAPGGPPLGGGRSTPPPPVPPAPPAPAPKPRVPGPGKGAWLAFLGVMLVSAAVVFGLGRTEQLAVSPVLAWGACVTVGLGAILAVVALTGRRLGFLGFMSVFAVLLSLLFASNAEAIRDGYDGRADWWSGDAVIYGEDPAPEPSTAEAYPVEDPIDMTAELASDYATIMVAGACTTPTLVDPWEQTSQWGEDSASIRLASVDENVTLDLTAVYTHVAVPAGTSIEVRGSGSTAIVWEGRDITCNDWTEPEYDEWGEPTGAGTRTVLEAVNPDTPVLTLTSRDGAVIYLEEVVQ